MKNNCKIGDFICPMLNKRTGNDPSKYYYRCDRMDRELKTVVDCEYAGDSEKQKLLKPNEGAVLTAKEFLEKEIKSKSWQASDEIIRGLFDNEHAFKTVKGMSVGRETLKKFLGGNWTDHYHY